MASKRAKTALAVGLAALVLGGAAFALGPRVRVHERWAEPVLPGDVEAYLARAEADVANLRPGDAKGIVWADPATEARTRLALVYVHGFSADRHEVEPLVTLLAEEWGANVFFTRLRGHGRDAAAMGEATVEAWLDDVAEAVAVGAAIGERVVLLGTSTGGTLAIWAATRPEARGRVQALVLVSPNLGLQDPAAPILLWPWGATLARAIVGAERCFDPRGPEQARHWTACYPTEALLPMMAIVARVRALPPGSLRMPTLVAYSRGDRIVDPAETERVMTRLASGELETVVVEGSGDPDQHVIAGDIMSPETTDGLRERISDFLASLGDATRAR